MTTTGPTTPGQPPGRRGLRWLRSPDTTVMAAYLGLALWLTRRLWVPTLFVRAQPDDQLIFEWMLARTARAVVNLENPLFTTEIGAPVGINLMANTSVLGLGIPLTPITLLAGPHVSFVICVVLSLAGTAAAWYFVLRRTLISSRAAAGLGALFCGFGPGIVTQAQGHLQMSAQFLVPFIVWTVFSLANCPHWRSAVRRGLVLALLVTYQYFLGAELLLLTALAVGTMVAALAIFDARARRAWRMVLIGLASCAALSVALLAYPLWFQFRGPASYDGLPFAPGQFGLDIATFGTYSDLSLGSRGLRFTRLAPNSVEQASFLGYPLLALCAVIAIWMWRRALVRAMVVTAAVFAVLSLGPTLDYGGQALMPAPYQLLERIPLIESIVPARFALVLVPIVGVLIALSLDAVWDARRLRLPQRPDGPGVPVRFLWTGAVVAAMLPAMPTDIYVVELPPVPTFITSGAWRGMVDEGRTVVAVPPKGIGRPNSLMYWSSRVDEPFAGPGGYFIGPVSETDRTARWGGAERPSTQLLEFVHRFGVPAMATDERRAQLIEDLRYWRAAIVVLGPVAHEEELRETLTGLLGPPEQIMDVWVWDVRDLAGA